MPNHVTHNCIVRGSEEEISRFIKTMFQEDEHGKLFDFNQVVPMPELLRGSESSSAVSDGLAVLGYESGFGVRVPKFVGKEKALERYMSWPWVKKAGITTAEQLAEKLIERNPDIIKKAQRAIKALEECGHIDWYGWSVQNWGTKWNSYSFRILHDDEEEVEFQFNTAWSFPEPVFDALAEEFPTLEIDVAGFDEGHCFCVLGQYGNGINVVKYNEHQCDPQNDPFCAEIYERAYGYPYEPYDEDDE